MLTNARVGKVSWKAQCNGGAALSPGEEEGEGARKRVNIRSIIPDEEKTSWSGTIWGGPSSDKVVCFVPGACKTNVKTTALVVVSANESLEERWGKT